MAPKPAPAAPAKALYLYGISRGRPAVRPDAVSGIDGASAVETVSCGGLLCWISRVERGEYAERLEQNMQNLDWLAGASVRHQKVVGALAQQLDLLPTRFGSVFLSHASLRKHVQEQKSFVNATLRRLAGTEEWGVKVFSEVGPNAAPVQAQSGADYLRQKSTMLQQRGRALPVEIDAFAEALRDVSVDAVAGPRAGQPGLLWQGAYLVRRTEARRFQAVLQRFAGRLGGARIESTGPWPPYSFVNEPRTSPNGSGKKASRSTRQSGR
ncbi:MAG TPA: GvpL/GvpF family gas vesicle protein [Terriglobales bacterium]|nr:GvpL/GvpF family gas vesicle protein [Terriglobales bacterium]